MSNPFSSISINNYNANPPTDDGAQTSANQINWAKIKAKVGDPLKAAIEALNAAAGAGFAKTLGNGALLDVATDLTIDASHQGMAIAFTAAGKTATLPDATDVGTPFTFSVTNRSTGSLTIAVVAATPVQTIDGTASIVLGPGDGGLVLCNGSEWAYIGSRAGEKAAAGVKTIFFQTAAPLGWTKLTDLDDVGIKIVSGTATDGGTVAFSSLFGQLTLDAANIPQLTGSTSTSGAHNHGYTAGSSSLGVQVAGANGVGGFTGKTTTDAGAHSHTVVVGNASPTPIDLRLKYAAAIRVQKN